MASIRAFSSLIEMRGGGVLSGHAKRVGEYMRKLIPTLRISGELKQDLIFATLLKDLGKMSLPDRMLAKPFCALDTEEMVQFTKHPIRGQAALMSLEQLENAAKIIRHQHEQFNRNGYPDHLGGAEIPLGARILAVASDYDALQLGMLLPKRYSPTEAIAYLVASRGRRYDPDVVDAFVKALDAPIARTIDRDQKADTSPGSDSKLGTSLLKIGMTIARDLVTKDGVLLLSRGYVLDEKRIDLLHGYEKSMGEKLGVYVQVG